ncbi:hypothetical protein G6F16_008545 [Rhizopus arrhizus]|uniref:Uncharacterized protein n=1 Tax=Rhizopus oryzae TaxID=64495 RepID=A0A9P6XC98_RHIOR|nr:hypothetical protein G6F22_008153 [Rhizopus arrhizus]KAG0793493.1 hypothetical protein G6F21_003578 [Rhizopus arrhizus]KAG0805485.1 hypothetical protein G6F20_011864 [Rhizopus arrhizus]KAG0828113.1 hypothetical protein G6F19_008411 [Rhizopus arrhizus]KAG0829551.1 hypothetical protein G6F18_008551 [Rhizopus arrhizus]
MEDDVILACRRIQMMLYDDLIDEDVVEEKIDSIKSSSNSQNVKAVAKLLSSVLQQFTVEKSEQKHETSLIIESLRPFIFSCVISRIKDIKFEWMTYRLIPPSGHPNNQTMLSDLVLKGDFANGHLESDTVKLGKEMQIAINKLILRKVKCPEVVGLLVEGCVATAYKMDLKFNGHEYLPGTDLMSKLLLTDKDVINIIVTTVIGNHANRMGDMKFYQRLIDYSRSCSRQQGTVLLPIVIAIVIKRTSQNLLALEVPGGEFPFAKKLSSVGWSRSCLLMNAESVAQHLASVSLHPLVALAHCLIEQKPSLRNLSQHNDPTLKKLYDIMGSELCGQVRDNQCANHVLDEVCTQARDECKKAKAMLEDREQDPLVRIQGAIDIMDKTISYLDEIHNQQHIESHATDFEFAEQQRDDKGRIPWKIQFDQWKSMGRFATYKSYQSAQSAYHRFMKK